MTPQEIVTFIHRRRLPLTNEKELQAKIAAELTAAGVPYEREVKLADGDVIDFMIGDVGLEVKIKGQRRAIYRQCERYAKSDRVKVLVLAASASMGLPETIGGKDVYFASLSRGWM